MVEAITFQTIFQFLQTTSIMVGIVYYLMILQNQQKSQQQALDTRQAQLLMQIYNRWDNPERCKAFTEIWNWDEWTTFEEFYNQMTPEKWVTLNSLVLFFEGLGVLIRTKKVEVNDLYLLLGGTTIGILERFIPILPQIREKIGYPTYMSETKYLYTEFVKYKEKHPDLMQ